MLFRVPGCLGFRVFRYLGFRDVASFGAWIPELGSCGLSSRDVRCTQCRLPVLCLRSQVSIQSKDDEPRQLM